MKKLRFLFLTIILICSTSVFADSTLVKIDSTIVLDTVDKVPVAELKVEKDHFYSYQMGVFQTENDIPAPLKAKYLELGVDFSNPNNISQGAYILTDTIVVARKKTWKLPVIRLMYGQSDTLKDLKVALVNTPMIGNYMSDGILMNVVLGDKLTLDKVKEKSIDDVISPIVDFMAIVLFFDVFEILNDGMQPLAKDDNGNPVVCKDGSVKMISLPLVVVWLIIGALFCTFYFNFINIRGFGHAINIVRGKYDEKEEGNGEVNHFQALATALSATVGLGNIAGVAIAIAVGGPGATFWMVVAGLIGMSTKFLECTLGVKFREIARNGEVSGGPMYYLSKGLKNTKFEKLGKVLAVVFAILCVGGSFGGGNMFQANQAFAQFAGEFDFMQGQSLSFGLILSALVGMVIIGGIKSIAKVTEKIVPIMAILYVSISVVIIGMHFDRVGEVFGLIFDGAFSPSALKGGFLGVLIMGFRRAAFSNEAGVGSASIAHSAVKTEVPVTEGIVALLEPFIDTVVICTMTALVLIFTGYHDDPFGITGAQLTSAAFGSVFSWFPFLLMIAILLFAFSTMVSWSYYGLKAWTYLFGGSKEAELSYKIIFLIFVVIGSTIELNSVINFSDMMILAMAFPNILGLYILAPGVKKDLKEYFERIKKG